MCRIAMACTLWNVLVCGAAMNLAILDWPRIPNYLPSMVAGQDVCSFDYVFYTRKPDTTAALWEALSLSGPDSDLTVLENDLALARNAFTVFGRTRVPDDLALVTWFRHLPIERLFFPPPCPAIVRLPFNTRPGKGRFSNTQAFTLPARTVRRLLAQPAAFTDWTRRPFVDNLLGRLLDGDLYGVVLPCIVEHIGVRSAYGWDSSAITAVETIAPDGDALTIATNLGLVTDG